MNYDAAVRYLLTLGRELAAPTQAATAKFDLENINILADRLGRPQRAYPSAHIAGTNGKEISDDFFAETFTRIHGLIEELLADGKLRAHPTYFECVTAMAFESFAGERVEFGVFEVGLGGRLDATNILHPVISIISRIDFDHENFLGHSLREIAAEKAGILKPAVPVVLAEQHPEAREVILARAKELHCPVIEPAHLFDVDEESLQGGLMRARVTETASGAVSHLAPRLPGRFQLRNALNALAAIRFLQSRGFRISGEAITQGIAKTVWPGRLEKLQSNPEIYLDGAHNPSAARELATFLEQNFAGRRIWLIYAALRDKAVDEVAGLLFPRAEEVIFTASRTSRAVSAAQLAEIAGHHAPHFSVIPDAEKALDYALTKAAPEDAVFITGSLYLIGQLRHYWKHRAQVATR